MKWLKEDLCCYLRQVSLRDGCCIGKNWLKLPHDDEEFGCDGDESESLMLCVWVFDLRVDLG